MQRIAPWRFLEIALAVLALLPQLALAESLTFFRSDGGLPSSAVGPLPDHLDAPGLLRWRTQLDSGHSSPVLCAGRVFVTTYGASTKTLATVALDQKTGRILWTRKIPVDRVEQVHPSNGNPASATPACDGERLFVFFGSYGLICYDLDGQLVWEHPFGPFQDEYGAGSSPVLVGDNVVLSEDHDINSFLVALDRRTGRIRWKSPRPDAVRSYSTPAVWQTAQGAQLLVAGALQLTAYNPDSGEKLWWINGLARIVIPAPVVVHDSIYMASWTPGGDPGRRLALDPWPQAIAKWDKNHNGKLARAEIDNPEVLDRFNRMDLDQDGELDQNEWDRHAAVFRQAQNAVLALKPSPGGRGDLTASSLVWKHQRGAPYVATPLVHNGIVWVVKDGGIVTKLDAVHGDLLQEERLPGLGSYFASPVAGDGKVYFASELGTISVVADAPDWRVLSSHELHEKIYATPALGTGAVFVRSEQSVSCFALALPRPSP